MNDELSDDDFQYCIMCDSSVPIDEVYIYCSICYDGYHENCWNSQFSYPLVCDDCRNPEYNDDDSKDLDYQISKSETLPLDLVSFENYTQTHAETYESSTEHSKKKKKHDSINDSMNVQRYSSVNGSKDALQNGSFFYDEDEEDKDNFYDGDCIEYVKGKDAYFENDDGINEQTEEDELPLLILTDEEPSSHPYMLLSKRKRRFTFVFSESSQEFKKRKIN